MWQCVYACYQQLPVVKFCRGPKNLHNLMSHCAKCCKFKCKCMKIKTNSIPNKTDTLADRGKKKKDTEMGSKGLKEREERPYIMLMLIAGESAPPLTAATIASDNKNQMLLKASLPLTTKQPSE